jgi:hypothetical protein
LDVKLIRKVGPAMGNGWSLSGAITKGYDKESHQAVNGKTRLIITSRGGIISGDCDRWYHC